MIDYFRFIGAFRFTFSEKLVRIQREGDGWYRTSPIDSLTLSECECLVVELTNFISSNKELTK